MTTMSASDPIDLLIYTDAYERVKDRLDPRVTALVMDAGATVTRAGETLAPEDVNPHIAWANRDMYNLGPVRDFMVTCLKAGRLRWMQSQPRIPGIPACPSGWRMPPRCCFAIT